jgi:general secretion pathway protein D
MKSTQTLVLLVILTTCLSTPAAQSSEAEGLSRPEPAKEADASVSATNSARLSLNFVNAPLDAVLNYLSKAAGFTIIKEVQPAGLVNMVSLQTMTKDEAVDLLTTVLYQNGCGVIRGGANDRVLTIVKQDDIRTRGIPVVLWDGDPNSIPKSDTTVTMVLPIRFVAANELLQNVVPLVPPSTPINVNPSGNSIIITDTQARIRRVAELIKAVDSGAEDVTEVRIFTLAYADPEDIAQEITSLFSDNRTSSGGRSTPISFGAMNPGGNGPRSALATAAGANSQEARTRARRQVVAVSDPRTSSVVVTASRDIISDIARTINALDKDAGEARNKDLMIYTVRNGDTAQLAQLLNAIFGNGTAQSTAAASALTERAATFNPSSGSRTGTGNLGTSLNGSVGGNTAGRSATGMSRANNAGL